MVHLYSLKTNDRVLLHRDNETGEEGGWTGFKPAGPFNPSLWNDLGPADPEKALRELNAANRFSNSRAEQVYNAALATGLTEIEARQLSGWEQ